MKFEAVGQNIKSNELIVFGKFDESDRHICDTGYVAEMDRVLFDNLMDFTIKFNPEIDGPITVSMSKTGDAFFVIYRDTDYINFDRAKIFVQETINRFVELEKRKVEIHGESLA